MSRARTAATVIAAYVLAAGLTGAPSASAATGVAHPATCSGIWNPANNGRTPANASWHVAIYKANNAQSCIVGWTTSIYQAGDYVVVHCKWTSTSGQSWYYMQDQETGVTGWLAASNVSLGSDIYDHC
ncbi:hypothetical protein [Actinospica robiniae]|uniref:hypothetical protein n=1 Tax=Actinospica robiniae TaxID=304901 RepID=UPI000425286D|nr:hypothetical protein [Actinospica robiniae]